MAKVDCICGQGRALKNGNDSVMLSLIQVKSGFLDPFSAMDPKSTILETRNLKLLYIHSLVNEKQISVSGY
jgi:hypothetical protein